MISQEPQKQDHYGVLSILVAGLLVGNTFGLLEFFGKSSGLFGNPSGLKLPLAQQLQYLAFCSYINWSVGLLVAIGLRLPFFQAVRQRFWPGWLVGGTFVFIFALEAAFVDLPLLMGLLGVTLFAIFSVRVASWIDTRIPTIHNPLLWAVGNLLGLVILLTWISVTAPLDHGFNPAGFFLLLPAVMLLVTLGILLTAKPMRRWAAPVFVFPFVIMGTVWFSAPSSHADIVAGVPNVVLISVDTLRQDHLGVYGNEEIKTPHIDSLAARSVVFDNAFSPIPLTNPSHSTMLTGLYPGNHGVVTNRPTRFFDNVRSLPVILNEQGYRTAAFVGGFALDHSTSRVGTIFEVYDDYLGPYPTMQNLYLHSHVLRFLNRLLKIVDQNFSLSRYDKPAKYVISAASEWLETNANRPFFLFIHLYDPHLPYEPIAPFDTVYDPDYSGTVDGDIYGKSSRELEGIIADSEEVDHLKALYKGEVSYTDEQIGTFLEVLGRLDLWDDTVIVFTADHGESLTEHGYYFNHSVKLYNPSLSIPLMIHFPNDLGLSSRVQFTTELTDLFPTILDFLNIDAPIVDGRSLMPVIGGEEPENPERVSVSALFNKLEDHTSLLALQTKTHKYIRTFPWWNDGVLIPASEELYDLATDPDEIHNVLANSPGIVGEFRFLAQTYIDKWFGDEPLESENIDEETLKKLRSLGYF